ncbi:hypothetical protein [Pedobacter frigoris]|uniref:hypothetical protein n=1 Tax=Pedobacter frigoris TaxID=2571272 RepID=UPI002930CAF9|nr:hypothetical protein [Pedobacter frigoris]
MEENNKVADYWRMWKQREERLKKLFPKGLEDQRPFLLDKLSHMETVRTKFAKGLNEEERLTFKILELERQKLTKQVYPNGLLRTIRNLIMAYVKRKANKKENSQNTSNVNEITRQLKDAGFGQAIPTLMEKVAKGLTNFDVPIAHYVSPTQRMEYQLSFSRSTDDLVQLSNIKAKLINERRPEDEKKHNFLIGKDELLSSHQAFNLLDGRAIRKDDSDFNWIQFDLNDRNHNGSYRVKEFGKEYDQQMTRLIDRLPINDEEKMRVKEGLMLGERMQIVVGYGGNDTHYSLRANPQSNEITIVTPQGGKVSIDDLIKISSGALQKIESAPDTTQQSSKKLNENTRSVKEDQSKPENRNSRRNRSHGKKHRAA